MTGAPGETENQRRFDAARAALGWSIEDAASRLETWPVTVAGWVEEPGQDVPRLAVLLLETLAKGRRPKLADRAEEILGWLRWGYSAPRIAAVMCVSADAVRAVVAQLVAEGRAPPQPRRQTVNYAALDALLTSGKTAREAGAATGVSQTAVNRRARDLARQGVTTPGVKVRAR